MIIEKTIWLFLGVIIASGSFFSMIDSHNVNDEYNQVLLDLDKYQKDYYAIGIIEEMFDIAYPSIVFSTNLSWGNFVPYTPPRDNVSDYTQDNLWLYYDDTMDGLSNAYDQEYVLGWERVYSFLTTIFLVIAAFAFLYQYHFVITEGLEKK